MILEVIKFIVFSCLIVIISKYVLVVVLRKLSENLKLKPRIVGNIAGISTSMPELLTISTSSIRGLAGASIYNVLSSNIINLIQYLFTIIFNKNQKMLRNKAIKIDIILSMITIIIPIFLLLLNIEFSMNVIPLFIIIYIFFHFLNNNSHRLFLKKEDKEIEKKIKYEEEKETRYRRKTLKFSIILILTIIVLFVIGELLGNTLENLCNIFNVPEIVVGVLLGFITSIPELTTFLESQKHHKTKENDMLGVVEATNNLLTSNSLNLFVIQSIAVVLLKISS